MAAARVVARPPAERRVHLDFHTPDFVPNVGERFEPERFAAVLADGEVQQAAFFAKCHYGNAYYPTRVGHPHPGLKTDMLGRFVAAAGARGIRTFAYYSLQLDRWFGREHPDCVQHPRPFFEPQCGSWTAVCVNGPYGDYARAQLDEIVRAYDVAGIWLDIVGYYPVCVCGRCRERYARETGAPVPFDDAKPEAGVGRDYYDWQRRILDEYTADLARMIAERRPGCELLCNTATGIREKAAGATNQADGQWCEEAAGHRAAFLSTMGLYCGLFDSAAARRPFEVCTQRFHKGWGDWTLRPLAGLQYDVANIVAHGGLPSIGDQLYGDGSFEPAVYERICETYRWLAPRQSFCAASEPAAEVAVFAASFDHASDPGAINYSPVSCRNGEGLFRVLLDAHCPAEVLSNLNALDGRRHAVLLIDENLPDTDEGVRAISGFLDAGGRVLSVGIGPRRYWPLLGIGDAVPLPWPVSYVCMLGQWTGDLAMPVLARIRGWRVTTTGRPDVLGVWAHPVSERTNDAFYSHQHAPAGRPTDEPAVWRVTRGVGSVAVIAAPIAADYWHTCYTPLRQIVMECLDVLLDGQRQLFAENLPQTAEVTVRRRNEALFVHVVVPPLSRPGVADEEPSFALDEPTMLHGVAVEVRLPEGKACKAINQLGQAIHIEQSTRSGYARAVLKPFQTHTVVCVDLGAR
jgi:hypothetical protein